MCVDMQEVLKQLQSKLEQEAGTLASSGRSDVLHQLKGLREKTRLVPLSQFINYFVNLRPRP